MLTSADERVESIFFSTAALSFLAALAFLVLSLGPASVPAPAAEGEELALVDGLLSTLASRRDLIFIRNGQEYDAAQAVAHLKRKLRQAGSKITTAEEFVDLLASESSISGKPYLVREPNKPEVMASVFFHGLLTELKKQRALKKKETAGQGGQNR
jgi:hypothetical protein